MKNNIDKKQKKKKTRVSKITLKNGVCVVSVDVLK